MQASMMFKLVTARAINSAFLLFIITDDEDQLDEETLSKVWRYYCRAQGSEKAFLCSWS